MVHPDAAVQESRERVPAAIENAGLMFPGRKRLIANLAPAAVRKDGPAYDLPVAVGVLITNGSLTLESVEGAMLAGSIQTAHLAEALQYRPESLYN